MKFLYRWMANGLAFYLALYLVDSLVAPRFYIARGWVALVLAIVLGGANSFIRLFAGFKTGRTRALAVVGLTVVGNTFIIAMFMLLGAPLSASNPGWIFVTALLLTLLAALLNWLIGFRPAPPSKVITRRLGLTKSLSGRDRR